MIREALAVPDVTPFASIESESDRITVHIRRSVSSRGKRVLFGWAGSSVGTVLGLLAVATQIKSALLLWIIGIVVVGIALVCLIIFIRVLAFFVLGNATVTFDGTDMLVQDFHRYRIPISHIRNIRHVAYPRRRPGLELHTPSRWLFVWERKTAMELELPEGRMEFFHQLAEREVSWMVASVNQLLRGKSCSAPPVNVDPKWSSDVVVGSDIYSNAFRYLNRGLILIFIAVAAALGAYTVRVEGARKWPIVNGTVVHASLARYSDPDRQTMETGSIEYRYAVKGHQYIGRDFGFARDVQDPAVRALILAHPDGANIKVYYNPRSPAEAVLIPGATGQLWMMFAGCFCPIILLSPNALAKAVTRTKMQLLARYRQSPRGIFEQIRRQSETMRNHQVDQ